MIFRKTLDRLLNLATDVAAINGSTIGMYFIGNQWRVVTRDERLSMIKGRDTLEEALWSFIRRETRSW